MVCLTVAFASHGFGQTSGERYVVSKRVEDGCRLPALRARVVFRRKVAPLY
jgi:hypothetical protein